jgi:hypothetical protein
VARERQTPAGAAGGRAGQLDAQPARQGRAQRLPRHADREHGRGRLAPARLPVATAGLLAATAGRRRRAVRRDRVERVGREVVGALAAADAVGRRVAALDRVDAGAAAEPVGALAAVDRVGARAAVDRVRAGRAGEPVRERRAEEALDPVQRLLL